MNRKINRRMSYTEDFRADAVQRALGGERVPTLAKELGINPSTLWNWISKARQESPHNVVWKKPSTAQERAFKDLAQEEVENLERAISDLKDRRDALQRYLDM